MSETQYPKTMVTLQGLGVLGTLMMLYWAWPTSEPTDKTPSEVLLTNSNSDDQTNVKLQPKKSAGEKISYKYPGGIPKNSTKNISGESTTSSQFFYVKLDEIRQYENRTVVIISFITDRDMRGVSLKATNSWGPAKLLLKDGNIIQAESVESQKKRSHNYISVDAKNGLPVFVTWEFSAISKLEDVAFFEFALGSSRHSIPKT